MTARRLVLGVLLLAAPAWAGRGESLAWEVESLAGSAVSPSGPGPGFHAMMYKEDPDRFAIAVGGWWARMSGPIRFEGGSRLDVSETFGLKARKFVPAARAAWRVGWLEIVFDGFWYDNTGLTTVSTEFEIDGVVFEVGDRIDSSVKIADYRLSLGITVLQRDWMTLKAIVGLGAIYTKGRVTALNADKTGTWEVWIPLPLIGFSAAGYLVKYPWVYEVGFGWIGFSTGALGAAAIDARASVGYEFNDWVVARLGYRFMGIKSDIEDLEAEVDLDGFYLEVSIFF